jgi:ribosomal protein S12 methylthiotransferase
VAVVTLGCAKNLVDSETMLATLEGAGFSTTPDLESADAIVVNTCGFIKDAVEESKGTLRRVLRMKAKGRCRAVICAGCLTQRYRRSLVEQFPEIDGFVGVNSLQAIGQAVKLALQGERPVLVEEQPAPFDVPSPRRLSTPPWTAYLRIAEGCDNACSFCTIPQIRGPQRSRPLERLLEEARTLASSGAKEINLIAQDTTRYGLDLEPKATLADLLRRLEEVDGLRWIRVLYGHPSFITPELIETIAASEKVCHYLDLPIQHVSREVLRGMNRGGGAREFARLFHHLRGKMPDLALRTTLLVGFPGESERDFEELLAFVEETRFDWLGAFAFSREEGTAAYDLPNQVPAAVKRRRLRRIMDAQRRISRARNEDWVGKEIEVVVEGQHNGAWVGRWKRAAPEVDGQVLFTGRSAALRPGTFLRARVTAAQDYDLVVTRSRPGTSNPRS